MTTVKEIIKWNKMIANLMIDKDDVYRNPWGKHSSDSEVESINDFYIEDDEFYGMKYYSDWDWIMPVVQKIMSMDFTNPFNTKLILAKENFYSKATGILWKKPDKVYEDIVEFVLVYDEEQNKKLIKT